MGRRKKSGENLFSDQQKMALFVSRTQDLVNEPIWSAGGLSVQIQMFAPSVKLVEPDQALFRSYMSIFRPFILNNEPVNFHTVRSIAHRHLVDGLEKEDEHLRRYKQMWHDAMSKGRFKIVADNMELLPEEVLDAHLYGYGFHYQQPHVEKLRDFEQLPVRLDKVQLYDTVASLTDVIIQLGNFIGYGLKHSFFKLPDTDVQEG